MSSTQSDSLRNDLDIIENMEDKAVLVVGDIMLDRFVYGAVERISPESPVPVLSVKREAVMLGGAGNTLSNLIGLKTEARILSVIGDDSHGAEITALAAQQNIDTHGLIMVQNRPTIVKTRFLAGHQQLLRTDYERISPLNAEDEQAILEEAEHLIEDVKVLILSDYGKGLLSKGLITSLIKLAKDNDVKILVDPKGRDYSIYRGADIVTPNKSELEKATGGMPVGTDDEIIAAGQHLIKESGISTVLATRSKDGMTIVEPKNQDCIHIRSASDIEVFDVSGAGDTVIATVAATLAAGGSIEKAASLANVAGSIVVSKVGTAPIRAEELSKALKKHDPAGDIISPNAVRQPNIERTRQAPVLGWNEAKEEIQRWKARGLNIGFTNGCFDILHFGHVSYLNDARRRCDRLILGLNSDASIRILKGKDRPVHNEESRASVLGALGAVDMVVIFGAHNEGDDNTAIALLNLLQPDIYFKGGDYTVDQIPEAPTVLGYGGLVDVMPVYDGHSTTASIEKMRA